MSFKQQDLVLYKYRPAIIQQLGEKIDIVLDDGSKRKVREKDILFMTDGPASGFMAATLAEADIKGAWEILEGEKKVSFSELMELIWSNKSPSRALALWNTVSDRTFFKFNGDLNALEVVSVEDYEAEIAKRRAKEEAALRFDQFINLLKENKFDINYSSFYQDLEKFAYGSLKKSLALQALGVESTEENAHALLLRVGFWDEMTNPYPQRNGLPLSEPKNLIPDLPEEKRLDLTHLLSYAIDDEGNKDPDDAISIDGDTLWVHIADCAALVPPNSELDLVAQERISNQYLPEKIVSMLPNEVVEKLGLGLNEISPALSFEINLDENGECVVKQVVASLVRVTRLSYREVNERIEEEPFASMLRYTSRFHAKRLRLGASDIRLPEVKIKVTDKQVVITNLPAYKSRQMVTDAMLMAGEGIARFCQENMIPIPYATQLINSSVEINEELNGMASMFARRKCFKRSQMKISPDVHGGLGMEFYTRTTSPLRRYLDLVVHQQLRAFINGKPVMSDEEILHRIGLSESISGSVSASERSSNLHWKLVYLMQNPQWRGKAVVVDYFYEKATLLIAELALEVKMVLPKHLALNSEVAVSVKHINLSHQVISFNIYDEE